MDKYIPLIAHEGIVATMERTIRRMWIVAIVLIVMLVGTNVAWLIYEAQFEGHTITAEQDGDGVNIVGNGDIDYGAESNN
jgi:hypothetical protein